jgi:hypothetical protein
MEQEGTTCIFLECFCQGTLCEELVLNHLVDPANERPPGFWLAIWVVVAKSAKDASEKRLENEKQMSFARCLCRGGRLVGLFPSSSPWRDSPPDGRMGSVEKILQ